MTSTIPEDGLRLFSGQGDRLAENLYFTRLKLNPQKSKDKQYQ
jgi:hypothetical protein